MKRIVLQLLVTIGLTMTACEATQQGVVTPHEVALPTGVVDINSIAIFADGRLVVSDTQTIWYRAAESSVWKSLSLIDRPPCLRTFLQLAALPDQRLGLICPTGLVNQRFVYTVVAYDWATDTLVSLVDGYLPDNGYFAWNRTVTRGVFASVDAFSTLYFLEQGQAESIPATIIANGKQWYLPDSVVAREAWVRNVRQFEGNHPVGLLRSPVWSPTQDTIAFWATLEPIGQQYELRLYLYTLYLMDVNTLQIAPLLPRIRNPLTLQWSPDGMRLVYSSEEGGSQPQGLWVYSLQHGTNTLLQRGKYVAVVWTSDGNGVYATRCKGDCLRESELLFFNLTTLAK